MEKRSRRLAILAAASIVSVPVLCSAQINGTWIGPVSGSWNVGSFWTSNPDFPSNGGTATFADTGAQSAVLGGGTLTLSALRFDSVAQVDIGSGSFNSALSFTGAGLIDAAKYKQNKPGVAPYYLGHSIAPKYAFNTGSINITGPGAVNYVNTTSDGFTAPLSITNAAYAFSTYYGLGAFSSAVALDGATLRVLGTSNSISRALALGAGGATLEFLGSSNTSTNANISGTGSLTITGSAGST